MASDFRTIEVPRVVKSKLRRVRGRKTRMRLSTAIVGAAAVLLAAMLVAMLIDWYIMPISTIFRTVLTGAAVVAAGAALVVWAGRALFTGRTMPEVASDVDRSLPRMEERWSTITELNAAPREQQTQVHPAIAQRVSREAALWEPHVEPRDVVSGRSFRRGLAAVTLTLIVLFVLVIADWQQTSVLLSRFWAPQTPISFTQIQLKTGEMLAARGEPVEIEATLSGRPVDEATLQLKPGDGPQKEVLVLPSGDDRRELGHRIRAADESFDYRLLAGDGRTEWQSVTVADRPKLAGVRFQVTPPDYTGRKPQNLKELPPTATIIEGSKLEVAFLPKEGVQEFRLQLGDEQVTALQPDDEGWYRWSQMVETDMTLSPLMTESHGLENRHPPYCHVHVYRDQAPSVRVVTPEKGMAVRPDDQIEIQFQAEDDFAIGKAELVVFQEPTEMGGEPVEISVQDIPLGDDQNKRRIQGSVALNLSDYELEDGTELTYSIRVYDTRQAPVGEALMADSRSPQGGEAVATDGSVQQAAYNAVASAQGGAATDSTAAQPAASQVAANDAQPSAAATPSDGRPQDAASATGPQDTAEAPPQMAGREPGDTDDSTDAAARVASQTEGTPGSQPSDAESASDAEESIASTDPLANPNDATGEPSADDVDGMQDAASDTDSQLASTDTSTGEAESATGSPNARAGSTPSDQATSPQNQASPTATPGGGQIAQQGDQGTQPSEPGADSESDADAPASAATNRRPLMARNGATPPDGEAAAAARRPDQPDQPGEPNANQTQQMANNNAGTPSGGQQQQPNSQQTASAQSGSQGGNMQQGQKESGNQSDVYVPEGGRVADFNQNVPEDSESPRGEAGAPRPGDNMSRRMLDIAQVGSSGRQQLKIDQWAGSFEGQRREKIALAIAPVLEELDAHLERAENHTHGLVQHLEKSTPWQSEQDRRVGLADAALEEAQKVIGQLDRQAADTPYSFISLQLIDVDQVNISPARDELWTTLQSDDARLEHLRGAWQHIGRARERLAGLVQQFQRIRREHQLADRLQTVQKMYQVYLEDAYRLLQNDPARINNYERDMAVFDLDEEYLARLREVLEMRRELMAELSRILSEDPRLLRRFMDRFVDQQDTLRDQLTLQAERQQRLERELRAWMRVDEARRPALAGAITRLRLAEAGEISELASRLNERFMAWLPLDLEVRDGDLLRARDMANEVAASARELVAQAASYRPPSAAPKQGDAAAESSAGADQSAGKLAAISAQGRKVYDQLNKFEAALRGVSLRSQHPEIATHVTNRLTESRELVERISGWVRKVEELSTGQYHRAAAIDQHQLATETQELGGKLANLEVQLAGALSGGGSNELPEEIAAKARRLLALFDNQLSPNQLGATYSLQQNRLPAAAVRQSNAIKAYAEAEKLFDEIIQETIAELDKLPVQDPIASLLDDPTLDELLAQLENERLLAEELGIPNRPSNLQVMGDWLSPGRGGGFAQMRMMINARLREQQQRTEEELRKAYERALARALKEKERLAEAAKRDQKKEEIRAQQVDWNVLVSELRDDLLQGRGQLPPEEFRRAIEQYFDLISRAKAEDTEASMENR